MHNIIELKYEEKGLIKGGGYSPTYTYRTLPDNCTGIPNTSCYEIAVEEKEEKYSAMEAIAYGTLLLTYMVVVTAGFSIGYFVATKLQAKQTKID